MKWFLLFLTPLLLAQTITDKKADIAQKSQAQESHVQQVNNRLAQVRQALEMCYQRVSELHLAKASEEEFGRLLNEVSDLKKEIVSLEEGWRSGAVEEAKQNEDGYAVWDQEETTLAHLVMEYGSPDYLFVMAPEMTSLKLNVVSGIPIPRESWPTMLEMILMHNGIGVKKLNAFTKQLYILKQDLGQVQTVLSKADDLVWVPPAVRVFYILSPPIERVKTVFQFFERFADSKQTFVHQIGSKIGLVAPKEEIEKLLSLYNTVWEGQEGKTSKVLPVSKMNVREMEKILNSFFGEAIEKSRPPFGKVEQEGLGVFSLAQSNTLVLIGAKESVDRAEKIVREMEEQLEDPAEMTVFLYTCQYTDPTDLAKVLEKVYISLINANQEGPTKETEIMVNRQGPGGNVPDGYPSMSPLVVSPPPLKPGAITQAEIEQTYSDHFIADPKTGNLLMTVRRDVLPKIKELLKKLDVPKRMVEIEVLLFERQLKTQNNFGLNLLKLGHTKNGATYTPLFGPSAEPPAKGVLQFFFHGPAHKYTPHFDIAYNFLMTQEDVQLNASPSLITVNQTPATIKIVQEISINNGAAPVDTNKGTTFEKSFSRQDYGIIIVLVPTIHLPTEEGNKGSVTLKTNITFDTTIPSADDRPTIDRRNIENEVRVVDGETVIIGGLRRKIKQDKEEKIPFFGEIPGFGRLFGSTQLVDQDTEMFFFITPKIIYDPKEELEQIRTEELKKRPGDIPEFLQKVQEATNKEKNRFFRHSMQMFFNHDR
jgi:general secretion pathway protein D